MVPYISSLFTYLINHDHVIIGLNWAGLKEDDIVVDVGGGIGTVALAFAQAHPHLRFIIQDRGPVVEDGIKVSKMIYT